MYNIFLFALESNWEYDDLASLYTKWRPFFLYFINFARVSDRAMMPHQRAVAKMGENEAIENE